MTRVGLRYGRGEMQTVLPRGSRAEVLHPRSLPVKGDIAEEIRRALEHPIGSEPLHCLARDRQDAVVLACDLTRDVPDSIIIPQILDELNRGGIPDERITVMVAGGAHRPITEQEADERFGSKVLSRVQLAAHVATDKDALDLIGTSSFGTEIWINRLVAGSSLIVGTGCIIPHVIAGYGGGRKLIVPGVAGAETIRGNHCPENVNADGVGFCLVKGNRIHEELIEAAQMARLEFIINVVWDGDGGLVEAVAGDTLAAWEHGVELAAQLYTVPVEARCDILLTTGGGAPSDVNFYQAVRGLQVGLPTLRDGGAAILVAACSEGVGSDRLQSWLRDATCPEEVLRRRDEEGFDIHGEHIACYLAERVFPRFRVFLVSDLPPDVVSEMMMTPAETIEQAYAAAVEHVGGGIPHVIVNPYGAKVVPTLSEAER